MCVCGVVYACCKYRDSFSKQSCFQRSFQDMKYSLLIVDESFSTCSFGFGGSNRPSLHDSCRTLCIMCSNKHVICGTWRSELVRDIIEDAAEVGTAVDYLHATSKVRGKAGQAHVYVRIKR